MATKIQYATLETATKIAAKKGDNYEVSSLPNGKFEVVQKVSDEPHDPMAVTPVSKAVIQTGAHGQPVFVSQAPTPHTDDSQSDEGYKQDDGTVTETSAPQMPAPTQKVMVGDSVTIEIPGAKLTAQYVITPVLGSKPRWFERKRLNGVEEMANGVRITAPVKELTSRGLGHLIVQLNTKANETQTIEKGGAVSEHLATVFETEEVQADAA